MGAPIVAAMTQCMCQFGAAPVPFNVLPNNKVMIGGKPVACIMDNKPMVEIPPFGVCTSQTNPAVAAAMGAPQPCTPSVPAPGTPGNPTVMIGGNPIMNINSRLSCTNAAGAPVISFLVGNPTATA